ncbi:hypothetical protein M8044_000299 [Columbia Basin potato purple top phytoplasma]|uniref:ATP synthase F0 subunit 8 n=1 Tax=Columbia Basin potato purple top phytoplasma TaxID=307134 RepID=A0ABT5L972_9MOLU|nr:hypothetical protein [Columbia Basin potato purple top phytoplasma]
MKPNLFFFNIIFYILVYSYLYFLYKIIKFFILIKAKLFEIIIFIIKIF